MQKKIGLLMCLILIVTAFASVAFTRVELCSYCNSRTKLYAVSNEYIVRTYTDECTKVANRLDIIQVWATDYFYACSNPSCGLDSYADTVTRIERICDH